MQLRGQIVSVYPDITLDQVFIQIQTTKAVMPEIESVRGIDADIEIKKHRENRSLNANSYFHLLCGKIANKLGITQTEVKNMMLRDYGFVDEDMKMVILRDDVDYLKRDDIHLRPIEGQRQKLGKMYWQTYFVMKPSHTLNTEEFSKLLDGTVSEAKELGIETMTPEQIKAMKERWKVEIGSD